MQTTSATTPRAEVSPGPVPAADSLPERILDATLELLRHEGMHGVTMRVIATRCEISATAVYRQYPSKASLFAALRRRGADELEELIRAGGHGIVQLCGSYLEFARRDPWLYRVMFRGAHLGHEDECVGIFTSPAAALLGEARGATLTEAWTRSRQLWLAMHGAALGADIGAMDSLTAGRFEALEPGFIDTYVRAVVAGVVSD